MLFKIKFIQNIFKQKTMQVDKQAALNRIQEIENETRELRKIIESSSVIDPKKLADYSDFCKMLNVSDSDDSIKLEIPGFDKGQYDFIRAIIKDVRIKEVYNGVKKLTRKDKRWYDWFGFSSGSGLVFNLSICGDFNAHSGSAARLALKSEQDLIDYRKKFQYIQQAIIDLPE